MVGSKNKPKPVVIPLSDIQSPSDPMPSTAFPWDVPPKAVAPQLRVTAADVPRPAHVPGTILLPDTPENRVVALMTEPRLPKAVMLDAMRNFENLAQGLMAQAHETMATDPGIGIELGMQGMKFLMAAVNCAEKVAPYIHAKLISIDDRREGDGKASFVVRAPMVIENSEDWELAAQSLAKHEPVTIGPAVVSHAVKPAPAPEQKSQAAKPAPAPPQPRGAPMPAGPKTVKALGTDEWLAKAGKVA